MIKKFFAEGGEYCIRDFFEEETDSARKLQNL